MTTTRTQSRIVEKFISQLQSFSADWTTATLQQENEWSRDAAMEFIFHAAMSLSAIADAIPNYSPAKLFCVGLDNAVNTRSASESPQEFARFCLHDVKNEFPELFT